MISSRNSSLISTNAKNISSAAILSLTGSIPWILLAKDLRLAVVPAILLFAIFVANDQIRFKLSRTALTVILIIVEIMLVRSGAIPEGSQSYRLAYQSTLISLLPAFFVTANHSKVRNVLAINVVVALLVLLIAEVALSVISPKEVQQDKWQNLLTEFSEAPIREIDPKITIIEIEEDDVLGDTHFSQQRLTTDQPKDFSQRVLFFGGSTTFDAEVSDEHTFPSQTQRFLNDMRLNVRVENHGLIGASAIHLNRELLQIKLSSEDIVVYFIGVNEAKNAIIYRNPVRRLAMRFTNVEKFTDWIFRNTNVGYLLNNALDVGKATIDGKSFEETESALNEAKDYVTSQGGAFVSIIQPHVFTRSQPLSYEIAMRESMGAYPEVIDAVYPQLSDLVLDLDNSYDARSIFDDLQTSPFLDWCHVDRSGNESIAKFMVRVLRPFLD